MKIQVISMILGLSLVTGIARAENYPANHCEVFVKTVGAAPSSHGTRSMQVIVKTGWLGNGEMIRKVGFWGKVETKDLGNSSNCHMSSPYAADWKFYEPLGSTDLAFGESRFVFPVNSGSVVGECSGFQWTWIGSFLVETDRNTYWVNPNMDSTQAFYFDNNGFNIIEKKGGWAGYLSHGLSTTREDMKYYNPQRCQ